jgi:hypothetical protein
MCGIREQRTTKIYFILLPYRIMTIWVITVQLHYSHSRGYEINYEWHISSKEYKEMLHEPEKKDLILFFSMKVCIGLTINLFVSDSGRVILYPHHYVVPHSSHFWIYIIHLTIFIDSESSKIFIKALHALKILNKDNTSILIRNPIHLSIINLIVL